MPDDALRELHATIRELVELPDSEWEAARVHLRTRSFQAGHLLISAGEPVQAFFYVLRGLVRLFFITEDGKEFNKAFRQEGDFVGVFSQDEETGGAPFAAEVLEPTDTIVLPLDVLEEFNRRHPAWQQLGRLQAERVATEKAKREASFMLDSARTRYERFLDSHPDLVKRLPQYHIASYLGITDVALSRIRRKMRGS